MTDNTHPSYPSPTIQEALCELRFPVGPTLFSVQFAQVWDQLRGEFLLEQTFVDALPPPALNLITSGPIPTQPRFVLRHAYRAFVLQFSPGAFTLNTLPPYLGWQTMREDIESAWQKVQDVLAVPIVTNVTVRYINRIPLPQPWEAVQGWIEPGDYVPTAVVNAAPPFQSRVQTGTGTNNITTVSISQQNVSNEHGSAMIVDLERTLQGEFLSETIQIMGQAEALHSDIWELFKTIKGPRWNDILEGKTQ